VHPVEQCKINMLDTYLGLKVMGKTFGYLPADPVLAKGGLNKNIQRCDEDKQRQEEPFQYFFKSPQAQLFKVQK
jgi:hypothetical protein